MVIKNLQKINLYKSIQFSRYSKNYLEPVQLQSTSKYF